MFLHSSNFSSFLAQLYLLVLLGLLFQPLMFEVKHRLYTSRQGPAYRHGSLLSHTLPFLNIICHLRPRRMQIIVGVQHSKLTIGIVIICLSALYLTNRGIRDLPLPPTAGDDFVDDPEPLPPGTERNLLVRSKRPVILGRPEVLVKNQCAWGTCSCYNEEC